MSIKTLNNFVKVQDILQRYEKRHAPKTHSMGGIRFAHWYKLNLYSDGSGYVEDTCGEKPPKVLFRFDNIEELYKNITK